MSHRMEKRINQLKDVIQEYTPGSTSITQKDRPSAPPEYLRIGLFGPTGVGKSTLINGMCYALTGGMWTNRAAVAIASQASQTVSRKPVNVTENITMVDNRGMISFGKNSLAEVGRQLAGVFPDGCEVEWNHNSLRNFLSGMEIMFRAKPEFEIHCAVLVISGLNLSLRSTDLREIIQSIKQSTGNPPIVVITHRRHPGVRDEVISAFRTGLQQHRIDYIFELENYTMEENDYDAEKHLTLLELLYQCAVVGDEAMKHREHNQGCVIS